MFFKCNRNVRLTFFMLLLTALVFSTSSIVLAETAPAEDPDMTLYESLLFDEIPSVFSASKYEQKVTQAPSSISIITAEEIRKFGWRTLNEILQSIRGFHVTYDRNYHYLGVRGFGLPSDYSNRILILLDGLRTNDSVYDASAVGWDAGVDVDIIDRIEVIRGPSSSLYGSNAFFAVINIITKRGRNYDGLEVSGDVGSFNTYKGRISYGKKLANNLEMMLSGSYMQSDGNDSLYYPEFDDPETNNGIAVDRDSVDIRHLAAKFGYGDFTLQANYHKSNKDVPTAPWETIFNGNLFTEDETFLLGLTYDHTYEKGVNLLAKLTYNHYEYYGEYPYEGYIEWDEPPLVVNQDEADGRFILADIQGTKLLAEKHKVTLGGSLQENFKQAQRTEYVGVDPEEWGFLDSDESSTVWALFLQDEFTITDKWILNAGLRYDNYETFGSSTNPRLALIHSPKESMSFKLIYGTAFRAPSAYELYFDDGVYQKGNLDLEPETIETFELIYEQFFTRNLRGTAVGFFNNVEDLIVNSWDPDDEMSVFLNIGEAEAYGLGLEVDGSWDNGWKAKFSYTYQHTEDKDTGLELPNSPEHLVKLNVVAPLWRDKIFFGFEQLYTSERRTLFREKSEEEFDNYTDSYFLTNITLYGEKLWKNLDVSASVYNLFDEDYSDPGSYEHYQDEIAQAGRTYRLKFTYIF